MEITSLQQLKQHTRKPLLFEVVDLDGKVRLSYIMKFLLAEQNFYPSFANIRFPQDYSFYGTHFFLNKVDKECLQPYYKQPLERISKVAFITRISTLNEELYKTFKKKAFKVMKRGWQNSPSYVNFKSNDNFQKLMKKDNPNI